MFHADPLSDAVLRGLILTPIALFWVIGIVRLIGLRTFSKMTAFDFVVTLATGSLLATAATSSDWPAYVQAVVAIVVLLLCQVMLAFAHQRMRRVRRIMENEPVLLMRDGAFIEQAMRTRRVAREDVFAKLREANALDLSKVRAVVLETTGDISVLHGDRIEALVMEGVRGWRPNRND